MEEKRLMKCVSCQSQYNVSKFQPGTKFRCAKCGTINVVPQAVAVAEPEPAPAQPAAPVRPTTTGKIVPKSSISSKRLAAAPGGLRKTGLGVKAAAPAAGGAGDEMGGIQVKKSNTKYYIIGIVAVVVIGIVIYLLTASGGSPSDEDEDDTDNKKTEKTEKKDKKAEDKKTDDKKTEEKKTGEGAEEKKPEEKKTEEPKEEPKKTEKKGGFEVDEAVRKEVWDILKEMPNQKDDDIKKGQETIKSKGSKAIPALIAAIGNDDKSETGARIAYYASISLKAMTKRDDAPNVNPMIGFSTRQDCYTDWKEWWEDNQDKFKD